MENIFVSPSFGVDKLADGKLEDKIDVFEDRFKKAIIDQAAALFSTSNPLFRHAGTSVLLILLPYFETIAQFRKGKSSKDRSREFFVDEFLRSFPLAASPDSRQPTEQEKKDAAEEFYTEVRCGLLHSSSPKSKVILSNRYPAAVVFNFSAAGLAQIEIYPEALLSKVQDELFPNFMAELRDPVNTELRANFEKFFDQN